MVADNYHDHNGVLRNKLGISDAAQLRAAEYRIVRQAMGDALAFAQSQTDLNLDTLKGIHRILFEDVYGWAGKTRTVPLFKGESAFAPPERITDAWMDGLMGGFKRAVAAEPHRFGRHLGELWGRLNWFHCFPEGNGRATQLLLTVVARRHGRDIDWPRVDADAERQAAIASVRNSFGAYEALLIGSLVPLDTERPLSQLWLERDAGTKS